MTTSDKLIKACAAVLQPVTEAKQSNAERFLVDNDDIADALELYGQNTIETKRGEDFGRIYIDEKAIRKYKIKEVVLSDDGESKIVFK